MLQPSVLSAALPLRESETINERRSASAYRNGQRVVVNDGEGPYSYSADKVVPPRAYRLFGI